VSQSHGNGPQIDPAARTGHGAWRTDQTRQKRTRKRAHRHDPLSFAAGVIVGAGLCLIWINIYAEVWL
jgi:hypothetical protein